MQRRDPGTSTHATTVGAVLGMGRLVSDTTAADGERTPIAGLAVQTTYRRSPRALGRLLVLGSVAALLLLLRELLNRTASGLDRDLVEVSSHLPSALGAVLDAAAVAIALAVVAAVAGDAMRRARRYGATLVAGPAATFAVASVLGRAEWWRWMPAALPDRWVSAGLAAGAAGLTIVSVTTKGSWLRRSTTAFVVLALAGGAWVEPSLLGRAILLAMGGALGGAIALAAATPSRAAAAADVEAALRQRRFKAADLRPHGGDARGSVPWLVELESGTTVFVKTYSDEERIADLLFRLWRRLTLRASGDGRPPASLEQSVEHEVVAGLRAASAGARVPRVLGLGHTETGGAYAIFESVAGRSFDEVADHDPDGLPEAALREAWSMVRTLHRAGIAHRDLRTANLVLDDEGQVWIVDFAFADVMADETLMHRDLAELLASTSALVGTAVAIDAAVSTLGDVAWTDALPTIQPLAVSSTTRQRVGRAGFSQLRDDLATALQAPAPDLPRLARVDGRTLLALLAIGAAVFALLPQLASNGELWDQIPRADRSALAGAVLASMVTYVGATLSLRGAVADEISWGPTFVAQLASSFTNRVTPAKAGGVALNVRWLVKEGVDAPSATSAIGLNTIGGVLVHVVMTAFVVVLAGKVGLGELSLPSVRSVAVGAGIVAGVIVVSALIPALRKLITHRVAPRARQSLGAVGAVAAQPGRLVMLFGGSALVTVSYIAALWLCLRAVHTSVPLSTVALVYLAGSALASAAPTPGGLGATEAVFAAALTTVGVGEGAAVSAVLLYRVVTFWLPIVPGWLAFAYLQRTDRL